jgi:hypothetical protein
MSAAVTAMRARLHYPRAGASRLHARIEQRRKSRFDLVGRRRDSQGAAMSIDLMFAET